MWKLREQVFIDGRLEVMGEEFYQEYLTAAREGNLLNLLDKYNADIVIFPYLTNVSWLQQLRRAPIWRLAYYDTTSVIYTRANANMHIPVPKKPETTPSGLEIPLQSRGEMLYLKRHTGFSHWLQGFFKTRRFPVETMNLGIFFYFFDQLDEAEAFLLDALKTSRGSYYETYNNLGAVYFKKKMYKEAAFCYQAVLREQPKNIIARDRLKQISTIKQ
jgi:tetratricopeptide (TPR) repeat protein